MRRFTPHFRLLAALTDARAVAKAMPELTGADREVLYAMLWHAGRRNAGEGCREGEAMFWRQQGGLAEAAGKSPMSVKRALRKLRELGAVRWRVVDEGKRLPSGFRASERCSVFYVAVDALAVRLGLAGTNQARTDQNGPFERTIAPSGPSGISSSTAPPATSDPRVNSVVNLTRTTENAAHPPPGVVVVSDPTLDPELVVEALVDTWNVRIGAPHGASAYIVNDVREALRRAVATGVPVEDLRDVIAGRADVQLGGEAYRWAEEHDVWDAGLFFNIKHNRASGCIQRFVKCVRTARDRIEQRRRVLERIDREEHEPTFLCARHGSRCKTPETCARDQAAEAHAIDEANVPVASAGVR